MPFNGRLSLRPLPCQALNKFLYVYTVQTIVVNIFSRPSRRVSTKSNVGRSPCYSVTRMQTIYGNVEIYRYGASSSTLQYCPGMPGQDLSRASRLRRTVLCYINPVYFFRFDIPQIT